MAKISKRLGRDYKIKINVSLDKTNNLFCIFLINTAKLILQLAMYIFKCGIKIEVVN